MSLGLLGTEPVRAVEVREHQCACGHAIRFIGVRCMQPQPYEGDYTLCPRCLTVYQIGEDWTLTQPAQRDLPAWVLELRDAAIREAK